MSLEQKVMDRMKDAMRAKDEAALRTLRAIKAEILKEKTSGANVVIDEAAELKMLQRMAKQRRDSLDIFTQQNRADLAKTEQEELDILEGFLPQQLSPEALREELRAIIAETGAASPADMGKVMGAASKKLAGRAEGKAISEAVKELLAK